MNCIHGVHLSRPCRECETDNTAREQRMKEEELFTFQVTGGEYAEGENP